MSGQINMSCACGLINTVKDDVMTKTKLTGYADTNWRAGASQPSRTTGTIFLYRPSGAHFTYAHAPNLRETPTRHVYPSPLAFAIELTRLQMQRSRGEAVWLQRPPKRERERHVCPGALLHTCLITYSFVFL